MIPTQDPRSDERISKAQHLLETWNRLARAHTMIGAGCSCGIGGVVVALEDFDRISWITSSRGRTVGGADAECLDQTREGNLWSISRLLAVFLDPPDCPSLRLNLPIGASYSDLAVLRAASRIALIRSSLRPNH